MSRRKTCVMVAEDDPQFQRFWMLYPLRSAKKDARCAWMQVNPDLATVEKMLAALSWQVKSERWLEDDGRYVPLPATWLRGERWDDEPPAGLAGPKTEPVRVCPLCQEAPGWRKVRTGDTERLVRCEHGRQRVEASPLQGLPEDIRTPLRVIAGKKGLR